MLNISDKLIVALDVSTLKEARHFVDVLYPTVKMFKIGSQLFTACGPEAVEMVGTKGARVFLDLKFHDIPNTVYLSVSTGTASCIAVDSFSSERAKAGIKNIVTPPVFMMTVHTLGGMEMLKAAVRGAQEKATELTIPKPFIMGVTRLTSYDFDTSTQEEVLQAAWLAKDAGLDGVVCAVSEAAIIRKEFGKDFIIVTPGIRPKGYPPDDQKRTATATEALAAGADFIVVGRPILEAKEPQEALKNLI